MSPPTPEIGSDLNEGRGRARRYSVTFWHGDARRAAPAWVVDDANGRVFVVIDDTLLFVCGCKLGGVASDRHTCGRYESDEGWIVAALERYIERHPEQFPPEPLKVVTAPEACDNGDANGAGAGCEIDGPPPRSVWAQLLDND